MYGKSKKSKDINVNDLDELLNSTLNDDIEDVDMNDPELLKQLQEISSGNVETKKPKQVRKKPANQPTSMDIDVDEYTALAQGNDDIDVAFDENDLSDPNLLNELSLLSNNNNINNQSKSSEPMAEPSKGASELMNMGFTQKMAEKALSMFDNDLERAANYLFDTPNMNDTEDQDNFNLETVKVQETILEPNQVEPETVKDQVEPEEEEEEEEGEETSVDPEYYKNKAQEYQKLALEAKRAGDKKKAVGLLRQSKNFNQRYQDLLEIYETKNPSTVNADVIETKPSPPTPPPLNEPQEIKTTTTTPPPPPPPPPSTPPQPQNNLQFQELLKNVIDLQKQYKEAALYYKDIGNLAVAKRMVRTSKELLHTGIKLKNGEITNLDHIKLPSPPDMTLGDGKIRQVAEAVRLPTSLEQIEAQLTYQMNICHNLSVQSRHTRKAVNNRTLNDNTQDNYARAEEAFSSDIVSLRAQNNIPKLHYEQVNYTYKNILDTIPENMMEFKIVRVTSLSTLDISTKLEPFVTWDFGGWPPENSAQASMNKGETPIMAGINPEFDFNMSIPITRTNRLFQRYVQRRKLTIEVFHNKYTYGLFRRPVSLGKAIIPMDRLLTKSSISGAFDLLDGRKKTGAKIEIEVNLREPLMGEDIAKRSERWLVLDDFGSNSSQCLSLAGLTMGVPYIPPTETVTSPTIVASPTIVVQDVPESSKSPKVAQVETPVKQTQSPKLSQNEAVGNNDELEAAEEEFDSVDNIVSNMVLEHEMGLVNAAIASGQSDKSKDDLIDRKQALEIKMNMLVVQVQTGLLDMDTYLENVQKRMDGDRKLALVFKKHGRLDLAKAALVRKKIMQDELDEVKAAMAEE